MSNKTRRFLPSLFRGRVIVAFLIVIQIAVLIISAVIGAKFSRYIADALNLISFVISFVVIVSRTNDAYKLIWIYLILAFPVFGGLLYLVFSIQGSMKLMDHKIYKELRNNVSVYTGILAQDDVSAGIVT